MFFEDVLSMFIQLECVRYIFVAFALYGVMLCIQKLVLAKVV